MKTKYPQYRVSQWIDTSPESMNKPSADIFYGVQARLIPRGPFYHVSIGGNKPMFDTQEKAIALIQELELKDREIVSPPAGG